jgi:hypothetical protein
MSRPAQDLQGKTFGGWDVLHRNESDPTVRTNWFCRCRFCDAIQSVQGSHLSSESRGCKRCASKTHGMAKTPTYSIWNTMLARCENPENDSFRYYGGRGIKVCEQWKSFSAFLADMGVRPSSKHSIDRRNTDGDYEPGNCFWATKIQQARNTRANRLLLAFGREQCIAAWAEELKIPGECIRKRIDVYGWSIERALTTPSRLAGKTLTIRSDGKRQWSLRSRGDGVDVSAVAKARGGGGHRNAAGFEENS